jgi:hypothetical protein
MKLLVLTSEPITVEALRDALPADLDPADAHVMVVAPAVQENPLKFWMSDADEAIAHADQVRQETVRQLDEAGVQAIGRRGESDPMQALEDGINQFGGADRILLFTHGQGYREDLDAAAIEQRFGIPVSAQGAN